MNLVVSRDYISTFQIIFIVKSSTDKLLHKSEKFKYKLNIDIDSGMSNLNACWLKMSCLDKGVIGF